MEKIRIRDKNPGSVTLDPTVAFKIAKASFLCLFLLHTVVAGAAQEILQSYTS
jgi:hypothetical protein